MKINFRSIFINLTTHPVVSIVSVTGTSLAIFLIMVVVMMTDVEITPYAPESYRDRMLHNTWTSIARITNEGEANGPMSYETYKEIFNTLDTPEEVSAYITNGMLSLLNLDDESVTASRKLVDDAYWHVFDFDFVHGRPFDKEEVDAGMNLAVVTVNTARALSGSDNILGRDIMIDFIPYRVVGVVKDVPPSRRTFANVYVPLSSVPEFTWNGDIMGSFSATILARDSKDFDRIRDEYNASVARYNNNIESKGWKIVTRDRPYDQEQESMVEYSNEIPDVKGKRLKNTMIYMILLLVPAINLSSMTESRLKGRMAEIGVRRAFGCTRRDTLVMLLGENLVITFIAGILGFALSVVFAFFAQDFLFNINGNNAVESVGLPLVSLLNWSTFMWALFFCFILNLLSTGIPAWRASRSNIIEAIAGLRK